MMHFFPAERLKSLTVLAVWLMTTVLCFFFMPLAVWGNLATKGLITTLALVVAAILLRAMRSFPIVNPDSFENEAEIKKMEDEYLRVTRVVVSAGGVAGAMLILMLIIVATEGALIETPALWHQLDNTLSATVGFLTIFLGLRIYYFVQLDFDIIRMQAKAVRKNFKKKQESIRNENDDLEHSFEDAGEYPGKKNAA